VFGSFGIESGVLAATTGSAPPGIRAWVADVNARGGLNGHRVRVIMADDGGDTAKAQAIVRKLVEQDKVSAIFYPYGFDTPTATLPYLESKGVPMLGHLSIDPAVEKSPIAFNPFLSGGLGLSWGFVQTLVTQTDKRKAGFIYCREVASCKGQLDGVKALLPYQGLNIVWEGQVSLAQPDYTAECISAQRAGVEVVITAMDTASAARFFRSCVRQGFTPVLSAAHQGENPTTIAFSPELDGYLFFARTVPYDSPRMADYRAAMARYQPKGDLGGMGAVAWVLGMLVEKRVAPLLGETVTSQNIIDAMNSIKNETLDGLLPPISFDASQTDRTRTNLCVIPIRLEKKRFVPHDAAASFVCAPN
jgi:branched-chain amino acid transport system substrate-binding protein